VAALLLALVTCLPGAGASPAGDPGGQDTRILLRNVTLPHQTGRGGDVLVNMLVVDGILTVVTTDEIATDEAETVIDCEGKTAFGMFMVDQPANIVVLDEDPRQNMDVLLDTRAHILFAMRDGNVLTNTLPVASPRPEDREKKEQKKRAVWIAYAPPPVALPVSYLTVRRWNQWDGKAFSGIFLGATALDRQQWVAQDADSMTRFGDLSAYNGGEIRAIRFGSVGTLNFRRPWFYTIFLTSRAFDSGFDGTSSSSLKVYDLRLDIPLPHQLTLSIGKQKEPISMERLAGGFYLPLLERASVLDAMLPARDVGVTLSRTELGGRMTWAGGLFNNWLSAPGGPGGNSNTLVGRVTWLPLARDDFGEVVHLGLGLRYTDGKTPLRYKTEPEFKQSPLFVDTGELRVDNALTLDLEASWRKGPLWISGEFLRSSVRDAASGDPVFSGFNVTGSWILTGETREYDTRGATFGLVRPATPVSDGGWGAFEVAARYSSVDLSDGSVDGGTMDILSLGGSWYLTDTFHLRLDYRRITSRQDGERGTSDGFLLRMVLMLD